MKLYEYEAKRFLRSAGLATPTQMALGDPLDVAEVKLPCFPAVVKVQLLEGKRGRRGGVGFAGDQRGLETRCRELAARWPEAQVLVEEKLDIVSEFYVSIVIEPGSTGPSVLLSRAGGVDIEELVRGEPGLLRRIALDPRLPLGGYQVLAALEGLGVPWTTAKPLVRFCEELYGVFRRVEATLVEVNPVAITGDGRAAAADAKITVDDCAIFRHPELAALRDARLRHDPVERAMEEHGIHYVPLDGDIGLISDGAGLTMAIIDWLELRGGRAACFLDVTKAMVKDWKALFSSRRPDFFTGTMRFAFDFLKRRGATRILINITSGGTPVDGLVQGLIAAVEDVGLGNLPPLAIHAAGNGQQRARELLEGAGLPHCLSLGEAVERVCEGGGL